MITKIIENWFFYDGLKNQAYLIEISYKIEKIGKKINL